ncbi:hypothetical protein HAX54_017603 [Datura stramonium]|uniref:Uncharacterized protein n=1 Tax=Datura stramonium TaxID=4076 RepID=A0ABS8S1B6_DATST|nr:hypothetical protein [Datura stramonium]
MKGGLLRSEKHMAFNDLICLQSAALHSPTASKYLLNSLHSLQGPAQSAAIRTSPASARQEELNKLQSDLKSCGCIQAIYRFQVLFALGRLITCVGRRLYRYCTKLHSWDSQVPEFISKAPIILTINPQKMNKVGLRLKEMGFDVTSPAFRAAFSAMSMVSQSKMERKLETYRSMGFSDGEILNIFKLQPTCMFYSEDNIRAIVAFYVDRLHLSLSHLSQRPVFLLRSLERRVIPRCSVMEVLWSRGIISKVCKLSSILVVSEKESYRSMLLNGPEVPDLQAAYRGELTSNEYSFHLNEIDRISMLN